MLLAASEMRFISKIILLIVAILFVSADYVYFTHPLKRPFRELLKQDKLITKFLSAKEIDSLFDMKFYTKNVGYIYKRVFK